MLKKLIRGRLTRREKIIAQVCCSQILDSLKKRDGELSEIEKDVLPDLERIIKKLEVK
jgi:phenylalanine-4-hydroxylase